MATAITAMQEHITELLTPVVDKLNVYDPDDMLDMTAHLSPPFAGLVYLGMEPNGLDKTGRSAKMMFGIYILGTKQNLKKKECKSDLNHVTSETDLVSITQYLQLLREAVGGQRAPSGHEWQLVREKPYDFGNKGVGYLQVWHATVQSI